MSNKLYVGNLNYASTEQELNSLFGEYGAVQEVFIPKDKMTGRARGFAFVTYTENDAAENAVNALNGVEFGGRPLKVNIARPVEDRPRGGGFGGGGGGGGGFGGERREFRSNDRRPRTGGGGGFDRDRRGGGGTGGGGRWRD